MTKQTEEMNQWLGHNMESYEFYMMHAILHDPLHRSSLLATPLTPDDFVSEEYACVIGALIASRVIMQRLGKDAPYPPTPEFLKTYISLAARDEGFESDVVEGAMKLMEELQDPSYKDQHYLVNLHFEAWYCSRRGKKIASLLQQDTIPDVHGIMEVFRKVLAAAAQINNKTIDIREFDFDNPPERPKPVLMLGEHTICTPGNISNVQGPPKACKTAAVEGVTAAMFLEPGQEADTLGFIAGNPEGRAVIHVDTEQSTYDHDAVMRRAHKRAMRTKKVNWLHSYSFTGMEPALCWDHLMRVISEAGNQHGGIKMVIIDGIADFCTDPNDAKECFDLVRKLHKLAIDHECVILTVLHENPGSASGKTRGHLGSQLDRKAETSLRLLKDEKTGVVTMWADRARHCFIPKSCGRQFHWCHEAKMHVTIHEDDEAYIRAKPDKEAKYTIEVMKAFGEYDELSYTELRDRIAERVPCAQSTAKSRIPEYEKSNLIEKTAGGKYRVVFRVP